MRLTDLFCPRRRPSGSHARCPIPPNGGIEFMEQRLVLSASNAAIAAEVVAAPDTSPIGIAPLPTPHPRPIDSVAQVGIEPNPTPVTRTAIVTGRAGIEPNPTPVKNTGGSNTSSRSDNSPSGMSSSALIAGMSSSAIVRGPGIEPNSSPAPIDPSPMSRDRVFTAFDQLDNALQRTGRR